MLPLVKIFDFVNDVTNDEISKQKQKKAACLHVFCDCCFFTFYTFKMAMPQLSFSHEYSYILGCTWKISTMAGLDC